MTIAKAVLLFPPPLYHIDDSPSSQSYPSQFPDACRRIFLFPPLAGDVAKHAEGDWGEVLPVPIVHILISLF